MCVLGEAGGGPETPSLIGELRSYMLSCTANNSSEKVPAVCAPGKASPSGPRMAASLLCPHPLEKERPPLWHLFFESENVSPSCPTLCDPVDCGPPGSSVHGILQARTLEWVAMPFSGGSFRPRDRTRLPHCRRILHRLSHQGRLVKTNPVMGAPPSSHPNHLLNALPPNTITSKSGFD